MGIFSWLAANWFEAIQTIGIVSGLLFTAQATLLEVRSRKIENFVSVNKQHSEIWRDMSARADLSRVLRSDIVLEEHPVSLEEELFVRTLVLHLDLVHRMLKARLFPSIQGLEKDIADFFTLPIPDAVWERIKSYQDADFVAFVETTRNRASAKETD